ncbi:unnamed protein product [Polarella glacialis]|uniref:Uncharacterized protein n=1 Tax=Polarella glacialis TaxID=89957 RepID=A0A813DZI4_POLGL|nr:unnamed protein product [Polarella glacialis]
MERAVTAPNLFLEGSPDSLDATMANGFASTSRGSFSHEFSHLEVMDAYHRTHAGPSYTMRDKGNGSFFPKPSVNTEYGPDITSAMMDKVRAGTPKWSMLPRPKKGAFDGGGDDVPAPGTYKNPTTLNKSHPTLPISGRGWSWGGTTRPIPGRRSCAPDPTCYDPKDNVNYLGGIIDKPPNWTMAGRLENYEDKAGRKLYDARGTTRKGGMASSPSWKFAARPESTMVPHGSGDQPGPGAHKLPKDIGGRMKRCPSWGFGRSARFGKDPEPLPY